MTLGQELWHRFQRLDDFYFGVSSLFLMPRAPELAWLWAMDRASNLSGYTYRWSVHDRPHRVHRLLLARPPGEIANIFERAHWQRVFQTFCHLHIRDGAVLYVVFVDSDAANSDVLRELNFAYFASGLFYSLSGFWEEKYVHTPDPRIEGGAALDLVRERLALIPANALNGVIRVWYDPPTFAPLRRPNDALYRAQRKLIHRIYDGVCQAPPGGTRCYGRADLAGGQVDHVLPLARSNSVLLNLSWLCRPCNLSKGTQYTHGLPIEYASATVPRHLATAELLAEISLDPPPCLKAYRDAGRSVLPRLR
ncbi:MAG TPA: HNH endonuclease signature motif containing protein [Solirubrobacteraceae bacterium]|nr:HNH endonuclease signature motif containing protein [Solirubrobacteraceae bacterium]